MHLVTELWQTFVMFHVRSG